MYGLYIDLTPKQKLAQRGIRIFKLANVKKIYRINSQNATTIVDAQATLFAYVCVRVNVWRRVDVSMCVSVRQVLLRAL